MDLADNSRAAARRTVPAWQPPVMGLSFAAGLTALALAEMAGSLAWAVRVVAVLLVVGCVALSFLASRRDGVTGPAGGADTATRWKNSAPTFLVIMAALLADAAYGQRWFFLVLGVGLGGTAWIQLARARRA